ncbi:hypothetical protein B0H10DRAFT_2066834, partial [Mycena sp. CBHHK59/15]
MVCVIHMCICFSAIHPHPTDAMHAPRHDATPCINDTCCPSPTPPFSGTPRLPRV